MTKGREHWNWIETLGKVVQVATAIAKLIELINDLAAAEHGH